MPDLGDKVTLQIVWRVNGVATDDAGTTINVVKPDGTTASLTPVHGVTGTYTADLLFAAQLGTWVVTFTAPTLGDVEEESFEVTSDPRYFGLGELRAFPDMANVTTYSDTVLSAARDWIEAIVERVCETSFVLKPVTMVVSAAGDYTLRLGPWARSVTSVTVDGVALTGPELLLLDLDSGGRLYWRTGTGATTWTVWPYGYRNITVTYLSGYTDSPPADLKEAMMVAARVHVLEARGQSGIPSRATSMTNEFGNVNFSTPGVDRPTGVPEADAVILGYAQLTRRVAVA